MTMTPRTSITVTYVDEEGITVQHEAVREGEFQVSEQATSWMREVAVGFWKKLNDKQEVK